MRIFLPNRKLVCAGPFVALKRVLLILLFSAIASNLMAAEYYMATNGNDSNPGTMNQPFATIAKFVSIAQPGDILYIRGGTYYPGETFINKSGTAGNYITIRNYQGETPIFDGQRQNVPNGGSNAIIIDDGVWSGIPGKRSYIIFDGLVIRNWYRGGFLIGGTDSHDPNYFVAENIIIRNCISEQNGQNAITISHTDNILIENCITGRTGWDAAVGSWSSNINFIETSGQNITVRNCASFHGVDVSDFKTDGNGLILDAHADDDAYTGAARVENSIFFKNGGAGIAWTKQHNAEINNCVLWENGLHPGYVHGRVGIALFHVREQRDINLRNNIVYDGLKATSNGYYGVNLNNLIQGTPSWQDPLLVDPEGYYFYPSAGSPVINAGTSTDVPTSSIGLDPSVFKYNPDQDQFISWWDTEIDYEYVNAIGGVANLFTNVARPKGNAHDIGAYEYDPDALIAVTAVTVTPSTGELLVGTSKKLRAIVSPGNASNKKVLWSSSDETIATVSSNGLVTAVGGGIATITATTEDGGLEDVATITVMEPTIFSTPHTITVDGTKENVYGVPTFDISTVLIPVSGPTDLSGKWTAVWNATHLFTFIEVVDDSKQNSNDTDWYTDDGVEIYIDADNSKATSYGANDFQYAFRWNTSTVLETKHNAVAGVQYKFVNTPNGYNVEVAIPWSTLGGTPAADALIGFDVHINDDDDAGTSRDGKAAWFATVDDSWQNPSIFGTVKLSGSTVVSVAPTLSRYRESVIYPNPTTGQFRIKGLPDTNATVKAYDALGRLAKTVNIKQGEIVDLSGTPGMYRIVVLGKGGQTLYSHNLIVK